MLVRAHTLGKVVGTKGPNANDTCLGIVAGVRSIRIDVSPLRNSRDFRFLFSSSVITVIGTMITFVALPFQVKELTDSYLAVGSIGLAQLIPMIVLGLWGGALADTMDRRTIAVRCELLQFVFTAGLVINSLLPNPSLVVIYILAAATAGTSALQRPSLTAIVPRVVDHDQLLGASALSGAGNTVGQIAGPAIGGILVVTIGTTSAYVIDAITFLLSFFLLIRLASLPPVTKMAEQRIKGIWTGLKFAAQRRDILGTYTVDWLAMLFAFPVALFPFIASDLNADWALGWLYAAGAIGGLLASLTSGWTRHIHHHGRAVVISAVIWCLFIGFFGLSNNIWVGLVLLALAGGADTVSGIFRITIWNQSVPDEMRGRLGGLEMLSFKTGPQVGQMRSSYVAELTSIRTSLVSGGFIGAIACIAVTFCLPALWRYDSRQTMPNEPIFVDEPMP